MNVVISQPMLFPWVGMLEQVRLADSYVHYSDVQFSKMIAEERAKRAATVDADAAATQARVEQAEKDYEARQRQEQDPAPAPGVGDPTVTAPAAKP